VLLRGKCTPTTTDMFIVIYENLITLFVFQLHALRAITKSDGGEHPLMINNFRDLTPVHGRLIRTNIKSKVKVCITINSLRLHTCMYCFTQKLSKVYYLPHFMNSDGNRN
jgi:hypothetical protein